MLFEFHVQKRVESAIMMEQTFSFQFRFLRKKTHIFGIIAVFLQKYEYYTDHLFCYFIQLDEKPQAHE